MAANGAAGGRGEAFPFPKDKTAGFAGRRGYMEMEARPRGPGEVAQVSQHFLFGEGQELGDFQGGAGLIQEHLPDGLAGGGRGFPGGGWLFFHASWEKVKLSSLVSFEARASWSPFWL